MAGITINHVIGWEPDASGRPGGVVVVGTAQDCEHVGVPVQITSDPVVGVATFLSPEDAETYGAPRMRGKGPWIAKFAFADHPQFAMLHCGLQDLPLRVAAWSQEQNERRCQVEEQVRHIRPSRYAFETGVLFVHGMGLQTRGYTLTHFTEPIVNWIERWFQGVTDRWVRAVGIDAARAWIKDVVEPRLSAHADAGGLGAAAESFHYLVSQIRSKRHKVSDAALRDQVARQIVVGCAEVQEAVITARATDRDAPPYARLGISSISFDGTVTRSTFLMAEAWWANTFVSPTFRELFNWSFGIIPLTLGTHFGARLRRAISRCSKNRAIGWWRAVRVLQATAAFVYFVIAVLLSPVVQVLLIMLFILSLPPIPSFRSFLLRLQERLAGTVGDTFALAGSAVRRASIVAQVKHDVRWLSRQCKSVVIVAHSQGVAVTHLALREERPPELSEIITFGSGLQKLAMLMQEATTRMAKYGWIGLGGLLLFWGGVRDLLGVDYRLPGSWEWQAVRQFGGHIWIAIGSGWILGLGLLLMVVGYGMLVVGVPLIHVEFWEKLSRGLGVKWRDYYASADPIPNGPLFGENRAQDAQEDKFVSVEIYNHGCTLTDHTSYWSNQEQFVAPLALRIASIGGVELGKLLPDDERWLDLARRWRSYRVRVLVAARWVIFLSAVVMAYEKWSGIRAFGAWIATTVADDGKLVPASLVALRSQEFRAVTEVGVVLALYGVSLLGWLWWTRWDARLLRGRGLEFEFDVEVRVRFFALCLLLGPAAGAMVWACHTVLGGGQLLVTIVVLAALVVALSVHEFVPKLGPAAATRSEKE